MINNNNNNNNNNNSNNNETRKNDNNDNNMYERTRGCSFKHIMIAPSGLCVECITPNSVT